MVRIYTCQEWKSRPVETSLFRRSPGSGVTLHHTASFNKVPLKTSAKELERCFALARSIQAFHMNSNGWGDSGQNFTVSRSGLILEGRHGSLAAAERGSVLRGAHAGDEDGNRTTHGVECEGTYIKAAMPEAQWEALVNLIAHLALWGKFQSTSIFGHRHWRPTQCPGDALAARIDELKQAVHDRKVTLIQEIE